MCRMTTAAVIQARMSSSRFPGKMLAPVHGMPLVEFVCRRVALAKHVDSIVVATSEGPDDDLLADVVKSAGFQVYRGSLSDVLGRVVAAARSLGSTTVVRVTGDCPLVDAELIDAMIMRFTEDSYDYLSNVSPP